MILTTTNSIERFKIADYLGIVTGVAIDFNKIALTQSKTKENYKKTLDEAKEEAFQQLKDHGKSLGANAIVGIRIDRETSSSVLVSVTGTAVKILV